MTDVFHEVDEEIRRERLLKLWRRYSKHVVAAAAAVVIAAIAVVAWRDWEQRRQGERAEAYLAASRLPAAEAIQSFQQLADDGGGYAVLSRLRRAGALVALGRKDDALAAYEAIAADPGVPQPYRDLATILYAENALGKIPVSELVKKLEPLTADASQWRFTARELTALAQLNAGDTAKARALFLTLADDPSAPAGLRGRATDIVAILPAS